MTFFVGFNILPDLYYLRKEYTWVEFWSHELDVNPENIRHQSLYLGKGEHRGGRRYTKGNSPNVLNRNSPTSFPRPRTSSHVPFQYTNPNLPVCCDSQGKVTDLESVYRCRFTLPTVLYISPRVLPLPYQTTCQSGRD